MAAQPQVPGARLGAGGLCIRLCFDVPAGAGGCCVHGAGRPGTLRRCAAHLEAEAPPRSRVCRLRGVRRGTRVIRKCFLKPVWAGRRTLTRFDAEFTLAAYLRLAYFTQNAVIAFEGPV